MGVPVCLNLDLHVTLKIWVRKRRR